MKKYKLLDKPSPVDERDFVAETIYSDEGELPETLDLRDALPHVRDQGSQGTCSAQTAACMKEWQERKDVGFKDHMSPQFIYNNRVNQNSEGMYPRDTMKILNKIGSVYEEQYPYWSNKEFNDELLNLASRYKIKGYAKISTIDGLKKALVKNGPCYFACNVYNYGTWMWKPRQGDVQLGGHAMTVVGYNEEGFIIRNSWGDDWGTDGYTVFPYDHWGLHREIWTTIDAESGQPMPPKPKKLGFFGKIWKWIKGLFS